MPSRRAGQLIDHLLQRRQDAPILEKKTRLPYGWALWLRALAPLPRPGHAREIVAVLLPRPSPAATGRLPDLGMARALRQLFWQGWDPPPRDQRWMRWTSAAISLLLHVLFFLGLLWIALISMPPVPAEGGQGDAMRVELLGRGAREGGGPVAAQEQVAPEQAAQAAAGAVPAERAASQAAAAAVPDAAQPADAVPAEAPQPAPAPPVPAEPQPVAASQPEPPAPTPPVQATEVAQATHDFVVPPLVVPRTEVSVLPRAPVPQVRERDVQPLQAPTPVAVPVPPLRVAVQAPAAPQVQVRERQVVTLQPAAVPAPAPLAAPAVSVTLPQREVQVRERTVPSVVQANVPAPQVAADINAPELARQPAPAVRERTIANAPAAAADAAQADTAATAAAAARAAASSRAASTADRPAAARPAPDPGNWATPTRGDDWGASSRNRDGVASGSSTARERGTGQQGLFNADGSVRVAAGEDGAAARGAPGGENDGWSRERIAASGTWLKRPPYDYAPTSFDKYWVPHESLLAEWVRKGVTSIEIPLPGTGSSISCVISVLQFGGGCGLSDPNMQEQPATARPPPDVPFKPALQEANGSR